MTNDFQNRLNDPETPVAVSLSDVGAPPLVAFGGIAGKVGILPFEFFNLTKDIKASKIYIRGLEQVWYQKGLPGVATDIDGIGSFLAEKREEVEASRVVLVGNSTGGYAAIVLGSLLAHPLTTLSLSLRSHAPPTCVRDTPQLDEHASRIGAERRSVGLVRRSLNAQTNWKDLAAGMVLEGGGTESAGSRPVSA